jgi:hypothetical protein
MENGTIIDPMHVTAQEVAKSIEKKEIFICWSTNHGSFECTSNDPENNII